MGTQFWWFYDVLTLCIAAGVLYGAVAKGFNKLVFRLIGIVLAAVIGFWGSGCLKGWFYEALYQDEITVNIQNATVDLVWDESVNTWVAEHQTDMQPKLAKIRTAASDIRDGGEVPGWFSDALGGVLQELITKQQAPHSDVQLAELFRENPEAVRAWLTAMKDKEPAEAASVIGELYYRPTYEHLVRMVIFLLLELVTVIIVAIIAAMAGNLEAQMHIRRGNRLLAVPVGLLEAAFVMLFVAVAVKLIVLSTDSQMMLFNQETIDRTMLFRWIYEQI